MVAVTALYPTLLAFTFLTEAFSIPRDSLGAPLYISGEEARVLAKNAGSMYTRDQAICSQVAIADLQSSIPDAIQDIQNIATSMWGGDWGTITTNPTQFPAYTAQACYPTDNEFDVLWDTPISTQSCPIQVAQLFGYAANGSSSSMVQIYQGTSVTLSTTVSKTVAWTFGMSFILKLQADFELFKATTYNTVWGSVEVANTHSSTTSSTQDARTTVQETITCGGPAEVEVDIALRQCTLSGHVDVPVTVTGWVWFFYPTKRDDHWDWALNFDNVAISQRQSNMTVSVNGDSTSYGEFVATCGCKP